MSSTCSSCRRRSPAIAAASSGSKPSMVMVVRNMRAAASVTRMKRGRELYLNDPPPALVGARPAPGMPGDAPAASRATRERKRLQQVFDDRRPGLRQIGAVVATATEAEHTAVTQALGEAAQVAGGAPVNLRREAQMSNGIALETVRTALQDDEFGLELLEVREHPRPDGCEHLVVRSGRQRHVELHASGGTPSHLSRGTRARIQVAAVFVQVG